ncbi:Pescadillo [Myxozyma melibiosi]|uniref:Pescadillo homolog n=1 Tax=Myxozyma melibiosi TaxID=54550 RepID=A0ABR1EYV3_9ASCO
MRIKKRHQAGAAKNFITRTQAVKKLQLSLADFRRICIFKGIYPRAPRSAKKANKGSTAPTTFYYTKDIQYLLHEPVIQKFREHKIFARKLSRALGRGDVSDAKKLDDNRPRYTLDRIIKERYPTFLDAVRDLDDALSMLFLFAAMPATDRVSAKITADAERLCNQWMAYVARERALRKVFVSIKGVYYEAEIKGQEVVWLVPFKFPQNIPTDIDFRIMLTFLEFYVTLLQFVLYKLYADAGLVYPPKIDAAKEEGVGGLSAYILESKKDKNLLAVQDAESAEADESAKAAISESEMTARAQTISSAISKVQEADADAENTAQDETTEAEEASEAKLDEFTAIPSTTSAVSDILPQPDEISAEDALKSLLAPFTIYVGREVPLDILEFAILSLGGRVISESALDSYVDDEDEEVVEQRKLEVENLVKSVTHQICDRPVLASRVPGRIYVQPQWVFDSLNKGRLLPVDEYAVGATLPPHLSPWGDAVGYDPENAVEDDEDDDESVDGEMDVDDGDEDEEEEEEELVATTAGDEDEDEEEDEALAHQRELEAEAKGVTFSSSSTAPAGKKRKRAAAADEKPARKLSAAEKQAREEKELRKIMMTNKQKKLYNQMQYGINKKEQKKDLLKSKRRKVEKTKATANLNDGDQKKKGGKKGKK